MPSKVPLPTLLTFCNEKEKDEFNGLKKLRQFETLNEYNYFWNNQLLHFENCSSII